MEVRGGAGRGIDYAAPPSAALSSAALVRSRSLNLYEVNIHNNGQTGVYMAPGRSFLTVSRHPNRPRTRPRIAYNGRNGIFISGLHGVVFPRLILASANVTDADIMHNSNGIVTANEVTLSLVNCLVAHNRRIGVVLLQHPRNTIIRNCRILDNDMGGIWVRDSIAGPPPHHAGHSSERVTITGCRIRLNDRFGIHAERSWLWMQNNTLSFNRGRGIRAARNSHVMLISNNILTRNEGSGIHAWGQSNVSISGSTISGNRPPVPPGGAVPPGRYAHGISGNRANEISVNQTRIQNNAHHGILAVGTTVNTRQVVDISDHPAHSGVSTRSGTAVTLEHAFISSNRYHGVYANNASITLRNSELVYNEVDGVFVHTSSNLTAEGSGMSLNKDRGVVIGDQSTGTLRRRNRIMLNENGGVWVYNSPGRVQIDYNHIRFNKAVPAGAVGCGINVTDGSNPVITNNLVTNNEARHSGGGIRIINARATIGGVQRNQQNLFLSNEAKGGIGGGIGVFNPSGETRILGNILRYNLSTSANQLFGRGGAIGLYTQGTTNTHQVVIQGNKIENNKANSAGGGISINNVKTRVGGPQAAHRNTIRENTSGRMQFLGLPARMRVGGGIYLRTGSQALDCLIQNNDVSANIGSGIHLRSGGGHRVLDNDVTGNREGHGISLNDFTLDNTIGTGNIVRDNRGSGVSVGTASTRNRVTENVISGNDKQGIALYSGGNSEIAAPIFTKIFAAGVEGAVAPGVTGTVEVFDDPDLEGERFVNRSAIRGDGTFAVAGVVGNNGMRATVVLIDSNRNTSEFGHTMLNLDAQGLVDAREMVVPGKVIPLNNDDDGLPAGPDMANGVIDTVADEADMAVLEATRLPNRLHGGHAYLHIDTPPGLRVFDRQGAALLGLATSATGTTVFESQIPDADFNNAGLALRYRVEGTKPGSHVVSLIYRDHNNREGGRDQVRITVVEADLDFDSLSDAQEVSPGGVVGLNDDDENGNGTEDRTENPVAGERDLVSLHLRTNPSTLNVGTVTLDVVSGGPKIRIWDSPTKTGRITLPASWTAGGQPATVYVEGYELSGPGAPDVELKWTYTHGSATHEDRVKVTVVKPDLGFTGVSELVEDSSGGRVVLNDDDDDMNGLPDSSTLGLVLNEGNLKEITLAMRPALISTGTLELSAPRNGAAIRVWQSPLKVVQVPIPSTWPVGRQPSSLWVEGIVPSAAAADVELRLRYRNRTSHIDDSIRVTVLAIRAVNWVATASSPLTPNPNVGGGVRIFPGKLTPTAVATQNRVTVQVVVQPPVANVPVHLMSFDVDDPSAAAAPVDNEANSNDNREGPLAGTFRASGAVTTNVGSTNASGTYQILFRVAYRPGDNYRILASLEPDVPGRCLAVQGGAGALIQENGLIALPGPGAPPSQRRVTDLLTVWRRAHVVLYAMTTPTPAQNDVVSGQIRRVTPRPGGMLVDLLLDKELPGVEDQYEGGMMRIQRQDFQVLGHRDPIASDEVVTIILRAGQVAPLRGARYTIWDDDLLPMNPPPRPPLAGIAVAPPITGRFANVTRLAATYAPAYIEPSVTRSATLIPFIKNVDNFNTMRTNFVNVVTDQNSDHYWQCHIGSGFQSRTSGDLDPDTAPVIAWPVRNSEGGAGIVEGDTYNYQNFTLIYLETLRETGSVQSDVVVHELGHQFECRHSDGGVMTVRGAGFMSRIFTPTSLNRIRGVSKP